MNTEKKETIKIIIDKYDADCGSQFLRVADAIDYNSPGDCCRGAGFYLDEYSLEDDLEQWKKEYNLIIEKDYR